MGTYNSKKWHRWCPFTCVGASAVLVNGREGGKEGGCNANPSAYFSSFICPHTIRVLPTADQKDNK